MKRRVDFSFLSLLLSSMILSRSLFLPLFSLSLFLSLALFSPCQYVHLYICLRTDLIWFSSADTRTANSFWTAYVRQTSEPFLSIGLNRLFGNFASTWYAARKRNQHGTAGVWSTLFLGIYRSKISYTEPSIEVSEFDWQRNWIFQFSSLRAISDPL